MALVSLSVVEQRYRAVLAVERGELKIVLAGQQLALGRTHAHTVVTVQSPSTPSPSISTTAPSARLAAPPPNRCAALRSAQAALTRAIEHLEATG